MEDKLERNEGASRELTDEELATAVGGEGERRSFVCPQCGYRVRASASSMSCSVCGAEMKGCGFVIC
ncbi:MAG: hypothetical protein ACI4PG_03965 [Candidatus Ventricola sp.]